MNRRQAIPAGYRVKSGLLVPATMKAPARASFDSSQEGTQLTKRFAYADNLGPNADNSTGVRKKVRARARYEAQNSTYARGITLTVANDTIGTGPRLQMLTRNNSLNRDIEITFWRWAREVRLAAKLRTMRLARLIDGEIIAELVTNPKLTATDVQLDLALYEAEQLTNPYGLENSNRRYDGIEYDENGNPTGYYLLDEYPGDLTYTFLDPVPELHRADNIIHYFRVDRAGQKRGVSEIQSALELFNMLRTYSKAVCDAAETAANHAGLLYTQAPPDESPDDVAAFYETEIARNMMQALPYGWDFRQLKAEQPTGTYAEFKREVINEIARCLNVPFNVAALNSSEYNYASGRLDHQTYFRTIRIDQSDIEAEILDRILTTWLLEWGATRGLTNIARTGHRWFWDGREHVDPLKEAKAQTERLKNNTTTLANEYSKDGVDWEEALAQRKREIEIVNSFSTPESE